MSCHFITTLYEKVERTSVPECGKGEKRGPGIKRQEFWTVNRTKWNPITLGKFQQYLEILFYPP